MTVITQHVLLYGLDSSGQVVPLLVASDGSISGGSASGAAGGDLTGTYPNPTIDALKVTAAKLSVDAVTTTKILDNNVTSRKVDLEFVGAQVTTSQTTTSTSAADLSTAGPSITPNPGITMDYLFGISCMLYNSNTGVACEVDLQINGAGVATGNFLFFTGSANFQTSLGGTRHVASVTTNQSHRLRYLVGANTGTFANRIVHAVPIS